MKKTEKLNKTRQRMIDEYVKCLKEDKIPWRCGWNQLIAISGSSKKPYRGVNQMLLSYIASEKGYTDRRWYTMGNIKENGWHLKKGSKSAPVEYWYPVKITVNEDGKTVTTKLTWEEYNELMRNYNDSTGFELEDYRISLYSTTYNVFNADLIEGIDKEQIINNEIDYTDSIEKALQNMKVDFEEKGSESYYSPSQDKIVLPKKELFNSQLAYDATKLHEMCHATGHPTRLNRPIQNSFGSKEYAKEELRAEIGSSFLVQELGFGSTDVIQDMGNHKAYIQSWIEVLENDPNELFRAIKDAEKITEYVKEKAELQKAKNIDKEQEHHTDSKEIDVNISKSSLFHGNINPKNLKINKGKEMQKDKGIDKKN